MHSIVWQFVSKLASHGLYDHLKSGRDQDRILIIRCSPAGVPESVGLQVKNVWALISVIIPLDRNPCQPFIGA